MRISTYAFKVPYWRYLTRIGNSIILWLYLISAIVYTFSPAQAVSKNPTNATVVTLESTNENLNATQLGDQTILEEFQVKSPDWTDIRLTIIEVTISILVIPVYSCSFFLEVVALVVIILAAMGIMNNNPLLMLPYMLLLVALLAQTGLLVVAALKGNLDKSPFAGIQLVVTTYYVSNKPTRTTQRPWFKFHDVYNLTHDQRDVGPDSRKNDSRNEDRTVVVAEGRTEATDEQLATIFGVIGLALAYWLYAFVSLFLELRDTEQEDSESYWGSRARRSRRSTTIRTTQEPRGNPDKPREVTPTMTPGSVRQDIVVPGQNVDQNPSNVTPSSQLLRKLSDFSVDLGI